jgi:hypothetical protein
LNEELVQGEIGLFLGRLQRAYQEGNESTLYIGKLVIEDVPSAEHKGAFT